MMIEWGHVWKCVDVLVPYHANKKGCHDQLLIARWDDDFRKIWVTYLNTFTSKSSQFVSKFLVSYLTHNDTYVIFCTSNYHGFSRRVLNMAGKFAREKYGACEKIITLWLF